MLTLPSPAKINLFLRVLRRRSDGFHELATLMQAIDFCDLLTFEEAEVDGFSLSDPTLPLDQDNLVIKARDLFRQKTGIFSSVRIHLEKRIPCRAGLGGGSSNAATTLWGLNRLFGVGVSDEELLEWGGELGSDVPFFFSGGLAYCTGRGERVCDLPFSVEGGWELAMPEGSLATPGVFSELRLEECSREEPEVLLREWEKGERVYVNDLAEAAMRRLEGLRKLKGDLQGKVGAQVSMTGSGSALFFESEQGYRAVLREPGVWYSTASKLVRC